MKNKIYALIILVVIVFIGIGYTTKSKKESLTLVRMDTPFPAIDFASFYVAKHFNWFEESLAKYHAKPVYMGAFGEIALSIESLAANKVDFITNSEIPAIVGKSNQAEIKIVSQLATLNSYLAVKKELKVGSFKDLKNKKIGVLNGSTQKLLLASEMQKENLEEKDFKIISFSKPTDILAAFSANQLDAFALFSPFPEQLLVKDELKILTNLKPVPVQVVLVGNEKFISQHPQETKAIINTLEKAKEWIQANPEEAQRIVSEQTKIDLQVIQESWSKINWKANLDPEIIKDIENKGQILMNENKISRPVNVKHDLIYEGS